MTESINTQENQEKGVGSYEFDGTFKSDHYCVGLDLVSLLLKEQICVDIAKFYDRVATDSDGWVSCGN